jgi:hypothetical protein
MLIPIPATSDLEETCTANYRTFASSTRPAYIYSNPAGAACSAYEM